MKSAILAVSLAFVAGTAGATTLSFDVDPINNGISLDQGYGDNVTNTNSDASGSGAAAAGTYGIGAEGATPNVGIDYNGVDPRVWTTGYSDLTNVFYIEPDGTSGFGLTLTADAGFNVTLESFDLGNYAGAVTLPSVQVLVDGNASLDLMNYALGDTSSPSQNIIVGLTGSIIEIAIDLTGLGGSSDNVGIDNVVFSQSVATSPVPLPAGAPLLLAGMGAFAWMKRRKG